MAIRGNAAPRDAPKIAKKSYHVTGIDPIDPAVAALILDGPLGPRQLERNIPKTAPENYKQGDAKVALATPRGESRRRIYPSALTKQHHPGALQKRNGGGRRMRVGRRGRQNKPRSKGETYNLRGTHSAITNELKKENGHGSNITGGRESARWGGARARQRRPTVASGSRDMIYCK
ncbi:hypothetical protein GEV33_011798 [Tenebrio molitor]|uniref:Uncharacterized protein n=1 Tax=Tenebrio molitor TaxID=7067 RepID=A0A8J6L7S0_TENMO|nr:hypothetical protein GEV33_011798 [Tenebrio molitor]